MTSSTDYHEFVFKDGKFLGKFEEMYKHSSEIPWHQDQTAFWVHSEIDIAILKQFKYETICEIGCGLGYFSDRLHKEMTSKRGRHPEVTGIDISRTAIEKAALSFPEIKFVQGDLLKEDPLPGKQFDLVVVKEVIWYICQHVPVFFKSVISKLNDNGFLYVSQSFPESDHWVGKEIIASHEALKQILCNYARPVHYCVEWDWNFNGRPLVHFLGIIEKGEKHNEK